MKTINLDDKLYTALEYFLEDYDDVLSSRGCNDLPREIRKLFTEKEGKQLAEEFAIMNNPRKPDGPDWPIMDGCLLDLIRHKMRESMNEDRPK